MGVFDNMNPDDAYLMQQGLLHGSPRFNPSMLDSLRSGIGNAWGGVKQAMANQGYTNAYYQGIKNDPDLAGIVSRTNPVAFQTAGQDMKDFATLPMAIPAIESVVSGGTGALMAGAAGGMIGGAADWGISQALKTSIMQEQARQSQAYARAVEAAYMNQRNGTEMGRNTDR